MKAKFFTDSVTECDCCGRTELKGTYLVVSDYGDEYYYGSTCVKRNLHISSSELTKQINSDKKQREQDARNEYQNSEIHISYNNALNKNYEFGDSYYVNTIKPLSKLDLQLKEEIKIKYNLKCLL